MAGRLGTPRLALLASGDFACNLYWQSLSFFLLFFYTDVLGLNVGRAGLLFALGSVWDGLADAAVGAWAQRVGRYRRFMAAGAAPLGMAFVALYVVLPLSPWAQAGEALLAHLAFRTLYAVVNIPFAALSARVTEDSRDRGRIAAFRMLFGTAAALVVALVTRQLSLNGAAVSGAHGYLIAAAGFAVVGTALLLIVALTAPAEREPAGPRREERALGRHLATLATNRAFVALNLASAATALGGGVLTGSVMYYFTHVAHAPGAGPAAMAWMGLTGAAAVPVWMLVRDAIGARALWLVDVALALIVAVGFWLFGGRGALAGQLYLVAMQAVGIGFVFAFWAMLPDTVEWGERRSGVRVEALSFGLASLGQKLALGAAAGLLGLIYDHAGYVPGAIQAPATAAAIRATMFGAPAIAIALSAAAMLANPLRRDTHARLTAELAARRAG